MTKKFSPKKVKLHWHGVAFDTGLPIHEVSDAWLMSPGIIGKYMGDDELAFYEVDRLKRKPDGFHLYEANHPRFFMIGTSKVGTDLSEIDFPELANMSFMDFIRIGFSLEREGSIMNKYNVSRSAVKTAIARLGLTKTQAQNVLPKYAQGAAFVWLLESTSGSQAVYDNYNERVRLVIAENGTVLDVFPIDYALQSPHNLSEEVCQSLKESTKKTLIAKRDEIHRKWCEAELAFHENSYEIAKVRFGLIDASTEDAAALNSRLAELCADNKRLHEDRSALRKERTELERALVPYI